MDEEDAPGTLSCMFIIYSFIPVEILPTLLQYLIFRHNNKENSETIRRPLDGWGMGCVTLSWGGSVSIRQHTSAACVSIRQHTCGVSRSRWGGQEFQQSAGLNQGNIERCTF